MWVNSLASYLSTLLLVTSVSGSPLTEAASPNVPRQSVVRTTGVAAGGVQPRLEIRTLQQQPDAWNLFLLAIERFKAMDQNDRISYYQICGIHGQPYVAWDGVTSIGNSQSGYCPHGSNLFGTWHKPYLALFEQILNLKAQEIASEFPSGPVRQRYQNEANKLRLPHWDWALATAAGNDALPDVITNPTAQVTYPNGSRATITNPLLRYDFHPLPSGAFTSPWNTQSSTRRATNNNQAAVQSTLEGNNPSIRNQLYQLLTRYQTFNQFSNTGSEQSDFGSIEDIHNTIHSVFRGGHMADPRVAAFDPVFWFHHCNVDRIIAIWQTLYPNSWVTPFRQRTGTFMSNANDVFDTNTPLYPFRHPSSPWWTSTSARPIPVLQHTYPELVNSPSNATLKATINNLYAPSAATEVTTVTNANAPIEANTEGNTEATANDNDTPRAYHAVVDSPLSLPESYSIDFFLGNASTGLDEWSTDPAYMGERSFLPAMSEPDKTLVRGSVDLTFGLEEKGYGENTAQSHDAALKYLTENLTWKVRLGNKEIDPSELPGLRVTVKSVEVQPATSEDDFPEYVGKPVEHPEVTENKDGGSQVLELIENLVNNLGG